ncbi:MAG: hypothetical protein ABI321_21130 [Polyangia bacterium]
MTEAPRKWTVEEALQVMDAEGLYADMLPNEIDGLWSICLSDERGNGIEYIEFTDESEAEEFSVALGAAIVARSPEPPLP